MLEENLATNINVTRKVNINLNGKTLTGNASFATVESGEVRLGAGQITGNLTVDTPNISFYNAATVQGTTTIKDIADRTFTNNGSLQTVVLEDATGTPRFVNGQGSAIQNLVVDTSQPVNLQGGFTKVTVKQNTQLNLANGSVINDLNTDAQVQATVTGGTVKDTSGNGEVVIEDEEVSYPQVQIKNYVTYRVLKDSKNFYGVQARIVLPENQHASINEKDQVVISLMHGDKLLSTSTSKGMGDVLKSAYFINEFAGEKNYASTLFVPNGSYPSSAWNTTDWNASAGEKPNRLKVEIKRDGKVVSSTTSVLALDEKFVDGSSKVALSWEQILKENEAPVKEAILAINSTSDVASFKAIVESKASALGLDLTAYNNLDVSAELGEYGQGDRQLAVITDILANRTSGVAVEAWTLARFTELFNAAVDNRTATQEALASVNKATKAADLKVEDFLGKVAVTYEKNQSVLPTVSENAVSSEVVNQLKLAIASFDALEDAKKQLVLEAVYNDGNNYPSWGQMAKAFSDAMMPKQ